MITHEYDTSETIISWIVSSEILREGRIMTHHKHKNRYQNSRSISVVQKSRVDDGRDKRRNRGPILFSLFQVIHWPGFFKTLFSFSMVDNMD